MAVIFKTRKDYDQTIFGVMKHKLIIWKSIFTAAILMMKIAAKAQEPPYAPKGAYTDYFRYFMPGNTSMPAGSANVSKGVVYLSNGGNSEFGPEQIAGSGFIIQTFRNDDTLCVCTAGHVAKSVFNDDDAYMGGLPYHVNPFYLYLDYLGRAKTGNNTLNETITGYKTSIPIGARLVKIIRRTGAGPEKPDIALFLLDKRTLPPADAYAMVGYDLNTLYGKPANNIENFYQIGHPNTMPQRITKDAHLYGAQALFPGMLGFDLNAPVGTGPGSSGSPYLIQTLGDGTVSNTGTAIAVNSGGIDVLVTAVPEDGSKRIAWASDAYATELSNIAADIKSHCWKAKTEARLNQTKEYKNTVVVTNNILPFNQPQTLEQVSDLQAIAAPNCYTVGTVSNNIAIHTTYLKASTCNIGGFTHPATYPGDGKPWQVAIAAKEVNVTYGFEYTPTGTAVLALSGVITGTSSASSSTLREQDNTALPGEYHRAEEQFTVYPNPSPSGLFNIALPRTDEAISLALFNTEGRQVYTSACNENPCHLRMPDVPRGVYILHVYNAKDHKTVFKKLLAYY